VAAADLAERDRLTATLDAIRHEYLPARLAKLGLAHRWPDLRDLALSEALFEDWLHDAAAFLAAVALDDGNAIARARHAIFEGAQGLLLDQDRGAFPHVTRSNTGLHNALALASEAGIAALDVTYVTRAYVTRHGAGPLPHELDGPPCAGARDDTNVTNAWQGNLRYAWLDLDILRRHIADDLSDAPASMRMRHGLAVTCLDQLGDCATFVEGGRVRTASPDALVAAAAMAIDATDVLAGTGPSRADVAHMGPPASSRLMIRRDAPMPAGSRRSQLTPSAAA
jgi:adenylosuccinate synthase